MDRGIGGLREWGAAATVQPVVERKRLAKQVAIIGVAAAGLVVVLLLAWVFVTMTYLDVAMR